MYFRTNSFRSMLTVLAASVFVSAVQADEPIFGEPEYWGSPDYAIVPGDFDHDGDIDLFGVHPPVYDSFGQLVHPGFYSINFNSNGLGSFNHQTLIDYRGVYTVFAVDLNADGNLDVIDGDLGVMLGHGDGSFGVINEYDNGSGHGSGLDLAFGDMDGDGDVDIVVPNAGPVLLNEGDGSFYTNFVSSDVAAGTAVCVGDINEDGVLDVATIRSAYDVVTIQLGLGDGLGNPGEPYTASIGGEYPSDLALVDMNGDDHLDLVTLNDDSDDVSVVFGFGDGTFGAPATYEPHEPAYYQVRQFKVVDVNGDGAPEAVVTCTVYGDAESHTETGLLLNDGYGALTLAQTVVRFGTSDENIVAADFDDDGNIDLANATHLLFNQLPAAIGMGVQPLDDFFSLGRYGGPFDPPSKTYTITNNEDFAIEFSAGADANWLTIDNAGGMIPAGGSVDVTVSINETAESLPHDDYATTLSLVNLTNHHGDRTREVKLQIGVPEVIYSFPLDTDPGWDTEGDWAFGQPTGQGGQYGSPDPTSGYTGSNVYGYNLNGDYPGGLWYTSLTTRAIDCSNLSHVKLRFRRWLGVWDQPDNAYIRLSTDGDFFLYIWASEQEVYDSEWQQVEYDLSPFADGKSTVYVQWTMGPTYFGGACGWNIDDVEILGVELGRPCTGDLDGNGEVGISDLAILLSHYGEQGGAAEGDLDFDGDIDLADLAELLGAYGLEC